MVRRRKVGEKQAICIGINDYPGYDIDLSGCVNDAHNWRNALMERGFLVKSLTDKLATKENIEANLRHAVLGAQEGDTLVFQYSGHGTQIPDENSEEADKMDEAWVPYDIYENGPILDDTLWKIFRSKKPGVKIILISDSCHSGSVARAFNMPYQGRPKFVPFQKFIGQIKPIWDLTPTLVEKSFDATDEKVPWPCLLLSGCMDNEYSYDAMIDGRPTGAFSYWALKTLRMLPPNATYQQWHSTIRNRLPNNQWPQTPNLLGSYKGSAIF